MSKQSSSPPTSNEKRSAPSAHVAGPAVLNESEALPDEPDDTRPPFDSDKHDGSIVAAAISARDYAAEPGASPEAVLSRRHLATRASVLSRSELNRLSRPAAPAQNLRHNRAPDADQGPSAQGASERS